MMYGIVRAGWMDKKEGGRSDKFAKAYPNESVYRHSLAEELDGMRAVLESVRVQKKEKRTKKLAPALEKLLKLDDAGVLAPYISSQKPTKGSFTIISPTAEQIARS